MKIMVHKRKFLTFFSLAILYTISYIFTYIYFLNKYFDYFGYEKYNSEPETWVIPILISILPIIFFRGYIAVSSLISLFIYLLVYVPTIYAFLFADIAQEDLFYILSIFMLSMCLLFYADRVKLKIVNQFEQKISINFFLIITIISTLFILYTYKGNLSFVSLVDVYELRSSNNHLGTNVFVRYLMSWLTTFLIPICLAYGIVFNKYKFIFIGFLSCIILYMSTGSKGTLFMPFVLLSVYSILKKFDIDKFLQIIIILITLSIVLLTYFIEGNDSVLFLIGSIFIMRTISIGGLVNLKYYEFFETHPFTYFSHINIVESITGLYPYGENAIGQVVGSYFWGDMNANANFWATDGISSIGIFGVILMSVLLFMFLIIINSITKKHNQYFIILLFLPFIGTLLNASFFSTLLSGGGFLTILALMFLNNEKTLVK